MILPEMKKIVRPRLDMINNLDDIPNIGVNPFIYGAIIDRVNEVRDYNGLS